MDVTGLFFNPVFFYKLHFYSHHAKINQSIQILSIGIMPSKILFRSKIYAFNP
jgi:hypothetical protein